MLKRILKTTRGFTLIELMIVVTIVGILAAIAAPNYQWGIIKAREAVLREDLYNFRTTIDQYYADQGKYPDSLQELVDNKNKYLREIPKDPFTKSNDTWVVSPPTTSETTDGAATGGVYEVHSGSPLIGSDGKPYNEW
ncbi:type II secretion system protein [Geomonas edaphica]|uniref:type II secretion system protein n=1 Tax=Geomonas edaphica TaxID=2570226 RepID=UPI0010A946EB|nr:type II secretion system protein [Geomonas edaphica]